jgi:alpha-L-arabinofuranosidase
MTRSILVFTFGVVWLTLVVARVAPAEEPTRFPLDARHPGPVVSPLLFGHNIEITRKGAWRGLYAEMVANRKFAGDAKADGLPPRWYPITGGGRVAIDRSGALAGAQCVRVEVATPGRTCGVGQYDEALALHRGTSYRLRAWFKSDVPRPVWVRLASGSGERVLAQCEATIAAGDWQLVTRDFEPKSTELDARLEIGSEQKGVFRIGAVSVQPADAFHGLRRDVVTLLKQLGPGVIRWPGGCFAEYYRWREGLLDVDRRPPLGKTTWELLLPDTDGYDTHEIGIDEFVALCREVGTEPAITVRLGEGTPEEMAAWVEYCNGGPESHWGKVRADREHREPYRVKYWFVGNEIYWSGLAGSTDPAVFVRRSRQFAEAMKRADPSIQLIGGTWFDPPNLSRWEAPLLKEAGSLLDLASYHQYMGIDKDAEIGAKIKAATSETRARLTAVRRYLDANAPAGKRLGITFDEWNLNWGRTPGDMPGGLFAAGMLNLLCREGDALGLALACYFMPVNEGCIEVRPFSACLNADGQVFALYRAHQGNRLLKTPKVPDDSDLDATASISTDGRRVVVTLVNRSLTRPVPVDLAVDGDASFPEAAVRSLTPRKLTLGASFALSDQARPLPGPARLSLTLAPGSITRVRFGATGPGEAPAMSRPRPKLLAQYPFEEGNGTSTADATGQLDPARFIGAPSFTSDGRFGRALVFHGASDSVDTGASLVDTTESFSVAAWMRFDAGFASTFRTAVSQDSDRMSGFYLQFSPVPNAGPGTASLRLTRWRDAKGEPLAAVVAPERPQAGRWVHVAAVQDCEERVMRLYVDGRMVAECGFDGMGASYRWPARGHTVIGRGQYGGAPVDPFLGAIDEVYLFQGVLSHNDVLRVMNNQFATAAPH